jgi:hypothetical protein
MRLKQILKQVHFFFTSAVKKSLIALGTRYNKQTVRCKAGVIAANFISLIQKTAMRRQ